MFRRTFLVVLILLVISVIGQSSKDAVCEEKQTYQTLLARVKIFDRSVDFKMFRLLYTETPDYNPYEAVETLNAMFMAIDEGQYEKALKDAQAMLERNYVDIDTHVVCKIAYQRLNNAEKYDFHRFVVSGLIGSILNSGDGKTPETAFQVINVREEYAVLNALGYRMEEQSPIESKGHNYARVIAVHKKTGETAVVYFNVDIPIKWSGKKVK